MTMPYWAERLRVRLIHELGGYTAEDVTYECDGGFLGGVYIYDTEEQAAEAWNRRADNGRIETLP